MIHFYNSNDTMKLLIQEECKNSEKEKIKEIIDRNNNIEISLLDIEILPSDIIKFIKENKSKIVLNTNNKMVWLYLRSLSIDIKLEYNKKVKRLQPFLVEAIALGGSAGSLKNIIKIIKELPFSDISVFIVVHILPNEKSKLVDILSQYTSYTVKEPENNEKVETKHIYVASPDFHMSVKDGYIIKSQSAKVNYCRPAIDVLFKSLAKEYKDGLIAILTCGYMDDGSRSLTDIKKHKGISIVQDPNECEANEIPLNAIVTKNNDWVFNVDDINSFIKDKLNFTLDLNDRIKSFIKHIDETYGYDFSHYDKNSLKRRIELLRGELCIDNFSEFEYIILHDNDMFEQLFKKISINVSEFFRDPNMFEEFEKNIIPILATYPHIRIWCSASSKGQEAYSVAMLLDKHNLLNKSIIYATDFNSLIIKQAKNALFTNKDYNICEKNYLEIGNKKELEKWFDIYDDFVEVKDYIKNKVQFFQHNLVTDGEINEFHIIFCRNVLIYFDEELQNKVIKLIHGSLVRDGYLLLGSSEHINDKKKFIQSKNEKYNKIFKKAKDL